MDFLLTAFSDQIFLNFIEIEIRYDTESILFKIIAPSFLGSSEICLAGFLEKFAILQQKITSDRSSEMSLSIKVVILVST